MDRTGRLGHLPTVSLGSGMEVAEWLRQIGLERYAELFAQHAISADVLPHLTAEDLKDAGVGSVGDRRRLLVAIRALGATAPDTPTPSQASQLGFSAERRQITALFCDIVIYAADDATRSRGVAGAPEPLPAERERRCCGDGGYIARVVGDAVLVYLGWPNADELHAESAVRAGLAIIDTI